MGYANKQIECTISSKAYTVKNWMPVSCIYECITKRSLTYSEDTPYEGNAPFVRRAEAIFKTRLM